MGLLRVVDVCISHSFQFGQNSVLMITFLLFIRHGLNATLRAHKTNIEKDTNSAIHMSLCQFVCELIPGVDVPDLDLVV